MAVSPMAARSASDAARDIATEFQNAKRKTTFLWNQFDDKLKRESRPTSARRCGMRWTSSPPARPPRSLRKAKSPGLRLRALDPAQPSCAVSGLLHWTPNAGARAGSNHFAMYGKPSA